MADERSPLGGSARDVLRKLEKLDSEINSLRADVGRLRTEGGSQTRSRAAAGEEASGAQRARSARDPATGRFAKAEDVQKQTRAMADLTRQNDLAARRIALQRAEIDRLAPELDRLNALYARGANSQEAFARQTGLVSQVAASGDQSLRRHGALTTEFLSAAARGDATLSEFRYQIGATIGKFAGWTAASAAVFGVLAAVRELGRGALDSLDSVNLLTRVINNVDRDQAAKGIGGLAEQFNLPIADVGQAVFQFAKIPENNTVPKALEASRAALFAVKVGELDAADAGRLLISIQQGLGESSGSLVGHFDQVNQAQNKFGVGIRDTLSGLAKSIGAFKAAGGTFDQALAIITTSSRVTGRSGEQIGTALQRSAGLVRRPINQQILREFGIDPQQGIGKIFEQAIGQSSRLSGRQRLRLATGLSTPQLAPYLVGVLNRPDLYKQVLKQTSPQASRGSAQRELDRQLKGASEQLQRVLTEVQVLGEELARLGAFDALGLFLKGLNQSLQLMNGLIRLINELPEPVRKAGIYAAEFAAALALAKRFNVGGALIGTRAEGLAPLLQQTPLQRGRRTFIRSTRNEIGALQNERERLTSKLPQLGTEAEFARRRVLSHSEAAAAAERAGDMEGQLTAQQRTLAAHRNVERISSEIEETMNRQGYLATRIAQREQDVRTAQKSRTSLAGRFGDRAVSPESGAPNTLKPITQAEAEQAYLAGAHPSVFARVEVEDDATKRVRAQAAAAQARQEAQAARAARIRANISRLPLFSEGQAVTGAFANAAAGAGGRLEQVAESAKTLPEKAGKLAQGAQQGASRLTAAIGPLEAAIVGFVVLQVALDAYGEQVDRLNRESTTQPQDTASARRAATSLAAKAKADKPSGLGTLFGPGPDDIGKRLDILNNVITGAPLPSDIEAANARTQRVVLANQKKNPIRSGRSNFLLLGDTLKKQLNEVNRLRDTGQLSLREYDKALAQALEDVKGSAVLNKDSKAKLTAAIRNARQGIAPLRALNETELTQNVQNYTAVAGSQTASSGTASAAITAAGRNLNELARRLDQRGSTPAQLASLTQATDSYVKSLQDNATSELQRGLLYARTEGERDRAYGEAIRKLRSQGVGGQNRNIAAAERRVTADRQRIQDAQDARGKAGQRLTAPGGQLSTPGAGGILRDQLRAADQKVRAAQQQGKQDDADLDAARRLRDRIKKAVADQIKQLRDQRFDERQASADLEAQINAAQAGPTQVTQTRILLTRAGQKVRALMDRYGRDNDKTRQAILEQTNLREQLANAISTRIGAEFDVRIAQTTDPAQKANLGVAKAKAILSRARGDNRLPALAQYYQALQEADQARLDQANAEFELQKSKTGDPLKQAAIQIKQDEFNVRNARGGAEKLRNRAQLNNDKRSYRQARQQDAFDNVEFLADIGKIDQQVELQRLETLLKTVKGNKQLRQQIQRRIAALKKDLTSADQFDLDVGSIKLPTAYEIRRAVVGGLSPSQMQVTNAPQVNVVVNDPQAALKVGEVLDEHLGTSTRGAMRAAGYRGG